MVFGFPFISLWLSAVGPQRQSPGLLLSAPILMLPWTLLVGPWQGGWLLPVLQLALAWCAGHWYLRLAWGLWALCLVVTVIPIYLILFHLR